MLSLSLYTIPLAVSGVLAAVVAYVSWRERPKAGAGIIAVVLLATAAWGIGEAIVATIADAHGWTVDVTEWESGGARFDIRNVIRASESESS